MYDDVSPEVKRLSREFMEELADAINKEVERQIKERNKPDFSKMTTREILQYNYEKLSKRFKGGKK